MTERFCYDGCCGRDPEFKAELLGETRFFCGEHAERFENFELEKI